jgi:photosystem II stability/assembly factor-like uncharacterized protein
MKPSYWMSRLLAGALLAPLAAAHGAKFADPLDTPAAVSPLAARALINGLAMAGTRIVGVGQRGHIVLSDDQGRSWRQAAVPLSSDLTAVHFASATQGWAVGHDGVVLHSVDAGASWSRQLDGRALGALINDYYRHAGVSDAARADAANLAAQALDKPFLDVWFENEKSGFVVGAFNLILHTDDGGASWQPWMDRMDNPKGLHLNAIRPVGQELYIVGEQGLVRRLAKGDARFEAVATPYQGSYFGVLGRAGALIVFGLRGNAFRSVDGGRHWQPVATGVRVGLNTGLALPDGRLGLVSQGGQILLSADDGASFAPLRQAAPGPTSAAVVAAGQLVLAGARGVRLQALSTN